MSTPYPHLAERVGWGHPSVLGSRARERLLVGIGVAVPLVLALAISVEMPRPSVASVVLVAGLTLGALAVVALMVSERYAVTVTLVALYLGLLEGPVKLGTGAHAEASVIRDVLIFSIVLGAVLRLIVRRERVTLPPLSAWVLGFVALVLVEAFNPNTHGIVKILGGFRQQLEWVPFFFFGYAIMRSKERFRKLFLVLGVIALANGVVSIYQARLSPSQLASWGPGYRELVYGSVEQGETSGRAGRTGLSGRTFVSEGVARVRPMALGTDAGFGGGVGVVALPGLLALLAIGRGRRRWAVLLLCLGALAAVATGLGRLQVVGAVVAVLSFTLLSFSLGGRVSRPLLALLGVILVALPLGAVLVSAEGSGTFSRYAEIAPDRVAGAKDKKTAEYTAIPNQIRAAPFGIGLGTVGSATGFGGKVSETVEGHGVGAATVWTFMLDELGLPGLLLWIAFTVRLLVLALPGLRRIPDFELRLDLAAVFSAFIALTIMGFSGSTMTSEALGPFFWFTAGIAAYWFAGPGRAALRTPRVPAAVIPTASIRPASA